MRFVDGHVAVYHVARAEGGLELTGGARQLAARLGVLLDIPEDAVKVVVTLEYVPHGAEGGDESEDP